VSIELFVFPPSPRSFKVLAVANHLDLAYTLRFVDLRKGDQRQADFAALNPNMRVPTLKDGDRVVWESNAICQYLTTQRPDGGLFPEAQRLDITRWQFWDLAHWDPACAAFVFQYVARPLVLGIKEPDLDALAAAQEPFHRVAKVLDGQLRGRAYVAGHTLTLADFSLGAVMTRAEDAHYPLEPYAEIKRWYSHLSALPAWQQTLKQCAPPAGIAS
jgi:glutathione S-transferase